jgi:uncharacterized membrane protein YeaQ/YmgE (transglycosylase-associated protein family)
LQRQIAAGMAQKAGAEGLQAEATDRIRHRPQGLPDLEAGHPRQGKTRYPYLQICSRSPNGEGDDGEVSMAIGSTALANFIVILLIGGLAGLASNRYGRSWLARLGATTSSIVTAALVGIAGAFIGFHISVMLGLLPSPLMHYILAAIGALAVLWLWRGR